LRSNPSPNAGSTQPATEIAQQLQTGFGAFFRVKLGGEEVFMAECGGKWRSIITGARNMGVILGIYEVAVHKVEATVLVDTVPHGVVDSLVNIVPTHVGDFKFCALGILQIVAEEFDLPGQ
jgi:hypothetical protein